MDKRTDLVFHRASGLDARGDLRWELCLRAVALEVGQVTAAIASESINEAAQLERGVSSSSFVNSSKRQHTEHGGTSGS